MKVESLGDAPILTAFCSVSGMTFETVTSSHSLDNLSASTLSSDLTCSPNKQSHLFNSSWRATSAAKALRKGVRPVKLMAAVSAATASPWRVRPTLPPFNRGPHTLVGTKIARSSNSGMKAESPASARNQRLSATPIGSAQYSRGQPFWSAKIPAMPVVDASVLRTAVTILDRDVMYSRRKPSLSPFTKRNNHTRAWRTWRMNIRFFGLLRVESRRWRTCAAAVSWMTARNGSRTGECAISIQRPNSTLLPTFPTRPPCPSSWEPPPIELGSCWRDRPTRWLSLHCSAQQTQRPSNWLYCQSVLSSTQGRYPP